MKKVICIGSASKDVFLPMKNLEIIVDKEKKEWLAFEYGGKIRVDDRYETPGGCAINVSWGLAKLGVDASCCCRVGEDSDGEWMVESLNDAGVDTALVQFEEFFKTDLAMIIVNAKDGERTILLNRDANEKLEIFPRKLKAEWIFVSSLSGDWVEKMEYILQAVEKNGSKFAYNPGQTNIEENRKKVEKFIQRADILFVNRSEAMKILKQDGEDIKKLLIDLGKLGAKLAVITDGDNGAYAFDGEKMFWVSAYKDVAPVEFTGAGDAFNSAFLAGYFKGKSVEECLKRGVVNGASVVQFYGSQQGLLRERELEEKIKKVKVKEIKI